MSAISPIEIADEKMVVGNRRQGRFTNRPAAPLANAPYARQPGSFAGCWLNRWRVDESTLLLLLLTTNSLWLSARLSSDPQW